MPKNTDILKRNAKLTEYREAGRLMFDDYLQLERFGFRTTRLNEAVELIYGLGMGFDLNLYKRF
jgi:hypothetical protein